MEWDPRDADLRRNYQFLTSAISPRPIAWVTTVDPGSGVVNAAPFSWYNAVCADPPMVMLAIRNHDDGRAKDTLRNIESTGEFVVNVATTQSAALIVQSSADYPPEISEVEAVGLRTSKSTRVKAPRLVASPAHMECVLHSITRLGNSPFVNLVLGEVVHFAADPDVLDEKGNIDPDKVEFLARMGGNHYADTASRRTMERPRL